MKDLHPDLAAIQLDLPETQQDKLLSYLDLLKKWNKTYNLTTLRNKAQMLSHHMNLRPVLFSLLLCSGLAFGQEVVLETNHGNIHIALDRENAPATSENFLAYARAGFYNRTMFHRVIDGFVIQGGGHTVDMAQKAPTRPPVINESHNGLRNERHTIAMARTADPDSATSQFFINLVDNPSLDAQNGRAGYTVFGRVVAGFDVAQAIARTPTATRGGHRDVPVRPVIVQRVRIVPTE